MTIIWKNRPVEERMTRIGRAVVMTDELDAIDRHLRRALRYGHSGHQGSFHPLMGETNVGKTTGQRLFMTDYAKEVGGRYEGVTGLTDVASGVASAEYVSVYTSEGRFRPIVRIEVGKNPTFNSLLADIYFCLTGRKAPRDTQFAKHMQAINQQLLNQGIKLIIFDDVQHVGLNKAQRSSKAYSASEVFKVLAKVLNAEIVLAGLPAGTKALVEANAQTMPLALNALHIGEIEWPEADDDRFCDFLMELSKFLPFDEKQDIHNLQLAQRIHHYSEGAIGVVKSLMRAATMYAIESELEIINQAVLARTVDASMMPNKRGNPFRGSAPPPPKAASADGEAA